MSKRTDRILTYKPVTMMRRLHTDTQQIRAPQPIGADVLQVQSLPEPDTVDITGPVTIGYSGDPSGMPPLAIFTFDSVPDNQTLTLWNFAWSLYIDPATFNPSGVPTDDAQWPFGTATGIYTGNKIQVTPWLDWATSSDTTNSRAFYIYVHNSDTVEHTLYMAFKSYFPNLNQS